MDKSRELFTPEEIKLFEEFKQYKTKEDVERWNEKAKALNESTEPLRLDMTIDEFDAKYKLKTHEDIMEMMKPL